MQRANFFSEENGALSMRRLLAFLFGITAIANSTAGLIQHADWKAIAFSAGLPLVGALLMMFFTSWSDVSSVIDAVKK